MLNKFNKMSSTVLTNTTTITLFFYKCVLQRRKLKYLYFLARFFFVLLRIKLSITIEVLQHSQTLCNLKDLQKISKMKKSQFTDREKQQTVGN